MWGKCGEENFNKKQNPLIISRFIFDYCGERGIRTPGPVTVNSFQDYRNRPLCHLSRNSGYTVVFSGANIKRFSEGAKYFPYKFRRFSIII